MFTQSCDCYLIWSFLKSSFDQLPKCESQACVQHSLIHFVILLWCRWCWVVVCVSRSVSLPLSRTEANGIAGSGHDFTRSGFVMHEMCRRGVPGTLNKFVKINHTPWNGDLTLNSKSNLNLPNQWNQNLSFQPRLPAVSPLLRWCAVRFSARRALRENEEPTSS